MGQCKQTSCDSSNTSQKCAHHDDDATTAPPSQATSNAGQAPSDWGTPFNPDAPYDLPSSKRPATSQSVDLWMQIQEPWFLLAPLLNLLMTITKYTPFFIF